MRNGKTIRTLQETVDKLSRQQNAALETSVYLPMSTAETKEYEERGKQLSDLRRELMNLTETSQMH